MDALAKGNENIRPVEGHPGESEWWDKIFRTKEEKLEQMELNRGRNKTEI